MFREEWQRMKNLIPAIFIALAVISCSCDSTEPPITVDPPGRRDYKWTRDTLRADDFGFISFYSIWGNSPNDVWVIGNAATYVNKIWHYDGKDWHNYLLDEFVEPTRMHGISSNELWMVTANSNIWKYDGHKWFKHTTIVPAEYKRILFEDIFGYKNNIYAVGIAEKENGDYTGVIVHFDGIKWVVLNTPKIKEYFMRIRFLEGKDILILGLAYEEPIEPGRLYKFVNGEINLVVKSKSDFFPDILKDKMYVSNEKIIYEYNNGILNKILDFNSTNYAGRILGRTTNDFFTINYNWNLGHYNGTDMMDIYHTEGYITDTKIFTSEIFVICKTLDNVNYILHGELK
jgi:hypothetical protein